MDNTNTGQEYGLTVSAAAARKMYETYDFIRLINEAVLEMPKMKADLVEGFIRLTAGDIAELANKEGMFFDFEYCPEFTDSLMAWRSGIDQSMFVSKDKRCRINIHYDVTKENETCDILFVRLDKNGDVLYTGKRKATVRISVYELEDNTKKATKKITQTNAEPKKFSEEKVDTDSLIANLLATGIVTSIIFAVTSTKNPDGFTTLLRFTFLSECLELGFWNTVFCLHVKHWKRLFVLVAPIKILLFLLVYAPTKKLILHTILFIIINTCMSIMMPFIAKEEYAGFR